LLALNFPALRTAPGLFVDHDMVDRTLSELQVDRSQRERFPRNFLCVPAFVVELGAEVSMWKFGRRNPKREEGSVLPAIAMAVLITALAIALSYNH
jgi:hypothetical protein